MRNKWINTRPKELEYYKGMLIRADTGVHAQALEVFQQYVPAGSTVLDVGAGQGAFSQRLADAGYRVTALDVNEGDWPEGSSIPFATLDINQGIAASVQGPFDAVCCLEVVEHVENPWSLMRDIRAVLRPGGRAVVSTPNITSFLSRLTFLRTGRFHQFGEADLAYGHIAPITTHEMQVVLRSTGLRLLEMRPGGYLPVFDFYRKGPASWAKNLMRGLAYAASAGEKQGWCMFFVVENPGE